MAADSLAALRKNPVLQTQTCQYLRDVLRIISPIVLVCAERKSHPKVAWCYLKFSRSGASSGGSLTLSSTCNFDL